MQHQATPLGGDLLSGGDAAIPATVTTPGEELFEVLVALLRAESKLGVELCQYDTPGLTQLQETTGNLWYSVFGRRYRECDNGFGDDGCSGCKSCNGTELEAATPLYRLALERAGVSA